MLDVSKVSSYEGLSLADGAIYEVQLPSDYRHLLNCICIYDVLKTYKCYNAGDTWRAPATRLTADMYSQVLDNFWNNPTYKRPYYYIHNKNTSDNNPYDSNSGTISANGTDGNSNTIIKGTGPSKTVSIKVNNTNTNTSYVERGANIRYGNSSPVRMEIRYGTDDSVFKLKKVYIDYIKAPQHIRLTQKELDQTEDISQVLEYPDDVCQEIINELVHIVMENISDQRIQTHPVVSQSIANPVQQQTETVAQPQQ